MAVECLDKASTAYGMDISAEKTKLMTNNTSGIDTEIKVNGDGDDDDDDIVERTSTAEISPKEQSEIARSCRENLWDEIQLKGPQRQKPTQE